MFHRYVARITRSVSNPFRTIVLNRKIDPFLAPSGKGLAFATAETSVEFYLQLFLGERTNSFFEIFSVLFHCLFQHVEPGIHSIHTALRFNKVSYPIFRPA